MLQLTFGGRGTLVACGVGIAFFTLALAAVTLTRLSDNIALLWLANAPLIAALCVRPRREHAFLLFATLCAGFAVNLITAPLTWLSPLFMLVNCGEPLLASLLLRHMGQPRRIFTTIRSIPVFVIAAGIIAPAATGLIAASMLWLVQDAPLLFTLSNWMIGHGLGALIGTPVALLVLGGRDYREGLTRPGALPGFAFILGITMLVAGVTFYQSRLPLMFLPILPVVAATMMFRFAGAALSVFAVAVLGAGLTLAGHGPIEFIQDDGAIHLQFFQFYLAVVFLIALPFATMMAQNQRLTDTVVASEARYRMIADNASEAMLNLEPDGTILYASPSVTEVSGFTPAQLVGTNALSVIVSEDRERVRAAHAAAFQAADKAHRFDYRGLTATGSTRWFQTTTRAVRDNNGRAQSLVCIVRDLSQQKAREADLEREATTDSMTGVLNRRAFQRRLAEIPAQAFGSTGVLALFDLDHFKQVNDSWGHASGDAALLAFADVMRLHLRNDDAIGRLGGEEFAILFPTLHPNAAFAACERIRQTLEQTDIVTPAGSFRVSVSIGLAAICPGVPPEAVFRQADAALYRAKAMGRNRSELAEI